MVLISKVQLIFLCLAVMIFAPAVSNGQSSGPATTHEEDNKWEAVAVYIESSDCWEPAYLSSHFASTFKDKLKENDYQGEYISNQEVDYWDFTDSTIWEDGRDHVSPEEDSTDFGTDWADAVFFATHGMPDMKGKGASYFLMGKDHGIEDIYGGDTCYVTTRGRYTPLWPFSENPWAFGSSAQGSYGQGYFDFGDWMDYVSLVFWRLLFFFFPHPGHISWGDGDVNAAVTVSCHSCEQQIWENHGYKPGEFSRGQFNMYAGIHGAFFPQLGYPKKAQSYFEDYMDSSIQAGIGQTWVEDMTFKWGLPKRNENCATAVTYGRTYAQRKGFFFNAGWKNFTDTGRRGSGSTFWGIDGCVPEDPYGAGKIECPSERSTADRLADDIKEPELTDGPDSSRVLLAPEELDTFESRESGKFSERNLLRVVRQITGSGRFKIVHSDSETMRAENDSYFMKLDTEKPGFNIRQKGEILDQKVEDSPGDSVYLRKVYRIMEALGAVRDEIEVRSENIIAINMDDAFKKLECEWVTRGFHVSRVIGGIEVPSNYVMITFLMDGSLLSIRGRWIPINYSGSQLYSEITQSEMVEMAFEELESENVDLDSGPEISLGTFYETVQNDYCEWVLDLRGIATVRYTDDDGRTIDAASYEFDI